MGLVRPFDQTAKNEEIELGKEIRKDVRSNVHIWGNGDR